MRRSARSCEADVVVADWSAHPVEPPDLTADRVRLEPMRPAHASELFAWMSEPALYRFLPHAPPHDVAALAATLRRWTGGAPNPRERWWNWVVRDESAAGASVGHVQLTFTVTGDVLVAWVFSPYARGRGFATEAVRRALRHVADDTPSGPETIAVAFVDERNDRSIALAERLGLRRVATPAHAAGGLRAAVGTLTPGELRFEKRISEFATAGVARELTAPRPQEQEVTIKAASDGDRPFLMASLRSMWLDMGRPAAHFHDDWAERFDRRSLELERDASLRSFVAERSGERIGCASIHVYESISPPLLKRRNGYIWGVYVRPEARRAGVAASLVERCVAEARELRCTRVVLHASPEGRPVYDRLGFKRSNEMVLEL